MQGKDCRFLHGSSRNESWRRRLKVLGVVFRECNTEIDFYKWSSLGAAGIHYIEVEDEEH
jgi:hypothetical protein